MAEILSISSQTSGAARDLLDRIPQSIRSRTERGELSESASPAASSFDAELEQLFPGLKHGELSSGRLKFDRDVSAEIQADPQRKRLYDSTMEFQSIFIELMLKSMRSTLNKENDLLHGGRSQEIFEDMLYSEHAKALSSAPGFDLGKMMYEELARSMGPIDPEKLKGGAGYESNLPGQGEVSTSRRSNDWEWKP